MRSAALMLSGLAAACAFTALAFGCGAFGSDTGSANETDAATPSTEDATLTVDAGVAPDGDAAPSTTDPGVYCAGKYCNPQAEVCCTAVSSAGDPGCLPKGDASACLGVIHACDDGADCTGGSVCCSTVAADGRSIFVTSCAPLLDCKKTSHWVVLCEPAASGACPGNAPCIVPDGGGYGFCTLP